MQVDIAVQMLFVKTAVAVQQVQQGKLGFCRQLVHLIQQKNGTGAACALERLRNDTGAAVVVNDAGAFQVGGLKPGAADLLERKVQGLGKCTAEVRLTRTGGADKKQRTACLVGGFHTGKPGAHRVLYIVQTDDLLHTAFKGGQVEPEGQLRALEACNVGKALHGIGTVGAAALRERAAVLVDGLHQRLTDLAHTVGIDPLTECQHVLLVFAQLCRAKEFFCGRDRDGQRRVRRVGGGMEKPLDAGFQVRHALVRAVMIQQPGKDVRLQNKAAARVEGVEQCLAECETLLPRGCGHGDHRVKGTDQVGGQRSGAFSFGDDVGVYMYGGAKVKVVHGMLAHQLDQRRERVAVLSAERNVVYSGKLQKIRLIKRRIRQHAKGGIVIPGFFSRQRNGGADGTAVDAARLVVRGENIAKQGLADAGGADQQHTERNGGAVGAAYQIQQGLLGGSTTGHLFHFGAQRLDIDLTKDVRLLALPQKDQSAADLVRAAAVQNGPNVGGIQKRIQLIKFIQRPDVQVKKRVVQCVLFAVGLKIRQVHGQMTPHGRGHFREIFGHFIVAFFEIGHKAASF